MSPEPTNHHSGGETKAMWEKSAFRKFGPALLMLVIAAIALTACGGGGSSSSTEPAEESTPAETESEATEGEGSEEGSGTSSAAVAKAKSIIKELGEGINTGPPPGPAAVKGKKVYAVACGLNAPGCSVPAEALEEAAKVLGWDLTVADGKLTPEGEVAAMKEAVTGGAEGVITIGMDCSTAKAGFEAVHKAGIPIVAGLGSDCNEYPEPNSSEPQVDKMLGYVKANNSLELYTRLGELHAYWTIANTNGEAKIITVNFPVFSETTNLDKKYKEVIEKECPGCEILAEKELPASALANPEAENVASALLQQYPEATVFNTDNDSYVGLIGQALAKSPNKEIKVISNEGYPNIFKLIEEGQVAAGIVQPQKAYYWGTADSLNRIFAGVDPKEIPNEGYEAGLVEKDLNLPPPGQEWETDPEYVKAFSEIWEGKNEG
jgi:ribose transport system substrate-binding protein